MTSCLMKWKNVFYVLSMEGIDSFIIKNAAGAKKQRLKNQPLVAVTGEGENSNLEINIKYICAAYTRMRFKWNLTWRKLCWTEEIEVRKLTCYTHRSGAIFRHGRQRSRVKGDVFHAVDRGVFRIRNKARRTVNNSHSDYKRKKIEQFVSELKKKLSFLNPSQQENRALSLSLNTEHNHHHKERKVGNERKVLLNFNFFLNILLLQQLLFKKARSYQKRYMYKKRTKGRAILQQLNKNAKHLLPLQTVR